MPATVNGIGTSVCPARGITPWHKENSLVADCDAVECFVFFYLPLIPLKAVHIFNRSGNTYHQIPIKMSFGLVAQAFLRRFAIAILIAAFIPAIFLILSVTDPRQKMTLFDQIALSVVTTSMIGGGILILVGLHYHDRAVTDIRYLLGRHNLGTSDPATWMRNIREAMPPPGVLFGTSRYADAVNPLLENGEFSRAMWAARLTLALEDSALGQELTERVLSYPGVREAIEEIRAKPKRWEEVATRPSTDVPAPLAADASGKAPASREESTGIRTGSEPARSEGIRGDDDY
jgi:hypothetical protein